MAVWNGWIRALCVALAVAAPRLAWAADTGTISGSVYDANGQPLAGATVKTFGANLPSGRIVVTGANGTFRFEYLLAGEYEVAIESGAAGAVPRRVVVEVGRDTQVDFITGLNLNEQITITAITPVVDVKSSEVSFNFKSDVLGVLPLERTYRGMFQLIPGVADNRSTVGPAAGGTRQDNTYLIDGANITNPAYGYLSGEVNQLDIAEVNIKRAAVSAEFGRTGGVVTNAVSRSGSNQFAGVARFDWLPQALVGAYKLPSDLRGLGVRPGTFRDPSLTTELTPAVGLGGPIVKDRAFFYGSARYGRQAKWERINKVGASLPDEVRTGPEFYGKLTAVPTAAHQLTLSVRSRPNQVENSGLNSDYAAEVASRADKDTRIATVEWANFITPTTALNVRYLHMKDINEDSPVRNLGLLPAFDPKNLAAMGQYTDPGQANLFVGANAFSNTQNYRRHELRGTFSRFFDFGRTSHAAKAGGGYEFTEEEFNRVANGWGTIVDFSQNGVPALRARYYAPQSPQRGQGHTYSVFVQDDVSLGPRVFVNAGLLLTRDEFSQKVEGSRGCPASIALKGGAALYQSRGDTCRFLRFGFSDELQPRLGISYQLREGRSDKAYANWGRYYTMDQKSAASSLAPNRIFQTQTIFDLSGNIFSSGPLASTTGKLIDPTLEPTYNDEFVVGYATPLGQRYGLDIFFVSRTTHHFIEDVPSRLNGTAPDSGPFVAANLPCVAFEACRSADARRSYRAVTGAVRRRLANRWSTDVSYTWSRFEGNFDLDYSTLPVFNTSSFIQDGPGTNVEDANRFGPLNEDRPHVVKVFAAYEATSRVIASAYFRVQSGTPWTTRARDWEGAAMNYLEPAGSHRNPTWANLDLMAAYRLPFEGRARLSLEARVLNVMNNQTRLQTESQKFLDLRTLPAPPYFAPYEQLNPFFGTGNAFAPPRRLHISFVAQF
jgi:Carboxypeptidase regulatory-like domain